MLQVFFVEKFSQYGHTETFTHGFSDRASAESAAAALNAATKGNPEREDEQKWEVYSMNVAEAPQTFIPQVEVKIYMNPFTKVYELSYLVDASAVAEGTSLPETVIHEPSENYAHYHAVVYARSYAEAVEKAQPVLHDLNNK